MKPTTSTPLRFRHMAVKACAWGGVSALLLGAVALGVTATTNTRRGQTLELHEQGAEAQPSAIAWQPSFEAALARAKASGKTVMVDFGAKWCGACQMMEEQTYPDNGVIAGSKNFVMVKVDVDERPDLANRYGISSLPTTAWLRTDGKPIVGAIGALDARDLVASMREAQGRAQQHNFKTQCTLSSNGPCWAFLS